MFLKRIKYFESEHFHISAEADNCNFGPNYGTDLVTKKEKEHSGRKKY